MKRRTLVLRIGDHWFLRHVRDLYETLTSKYTTADQPRGIMSIFHKDMKSPFWSREKEVDGNMASYFKDAESKKAFSQALDDDAELKLYIAGHSSAGCSKLQSLETNQSLMFEIGAQSVAAKLDKIFKALQVKPTAAKPIKISLICCEAASGVGFGNKKSAFAAKLLMYLHELGHKHILVKARELSVSAPIFGVKQTAGKKEHFYLDGNHKIYHVEKQNDLRLMTLNVIKKCHTNTSVNNKQKYLEYCISQINKLGYTTEKEQIGALKKIISDALKNEDIKSYRYGTAWFMKLFGIKSNTEKSIQKLHDRLAERSDTYSTLVDEVKPQKK